ncbi:MAG: TonB-dependent receptor [Acidobacteria bacterium]|nr:TonB-dependent receptor [Acidobacteriota bacterium]
MRLSRPARILLSLVILCAPAAAVAQNTAGVGTIAGMVRDADGTPVGGVRVCLVGSERCAASGTTGSFEIAELRPSSYQLLIEPAGQPPIASDPVEVRAGYTAQVEVTLPKLEAVQQTITVTAPALRLPEEVKSSAQVILPGEVFSSAGALQDVSRYVQALPGVAIGSDDFRNDLIVRGGSPLENLFIVDNVEIPNINTFANAASAGGSYSILDAALLQDVTFLTGGYPAPYINRTSSVMQITQREGSRTRLQGRATVGFAGAGFVGEGPIRGGKGSWVVSMRRSFLDLFTDDVGIGGVPVSYTFNAKGVYDLSPADRVWIVNLTGRDSIRLGATQDVADPTSELNNFDIRYEGWRSATGLNWQRLFGARGVGLLGVSYSDASTTSAVKDLLAFGIPPPDVPIDDVIVATPASFGEQSREQETTLKYDLTSYAPVLHKIQAGGSVKQFRLTYDIAQPYGYDSPYSPVPNQNPITLKTAFTAWQSSAYLQATEDLTRRLNVTWGARVDHYQYISQTRVSPRLAGSVQITDRVAWKASAGVYYQQPFFVFLAAFPENGATRPFRADHVVTGLAFSGSGGLRLTAEVFVKHYRDYPVSTQYPSVSLANVGDTFNVREILFPTTSAGRGRVRGVEFYAERRTGDRWFGQANLSISQTQHAGLDGVLRPGSFDYPLIANVVGGHRFNRKWEASTRISYLSGRPYTPFDLAASTAQNRGIYNLAQVNAARAPDYFRWDVRVDRTFTVRGQAVIVFAGAQNLTNRRNWSGYSWDRRANGPRFDEQLGLFPVLGIDWRF